MCPYARACVICVGILDGDSGRKEWDNYEIWMAY